MTLNEFIFKLEELADAGYGNLDVVTDRNQQVYTVEYSEDSPPAIVVEFES